MGNLKSLLMERSMGIIYGVRALNEVRKESSLNEGFEPVVFDWRRDRRTYIESLFLSLNKTDAVLPSAYQENTMACKVPVPGYATDGEMLQSDQCQVSIKFMGTHKTSDFEIDVMAPRSEYSRKEYVAYRINIDHENAITEESYPDEDLIEVHLGMTETMERMIFALEAFSLKIFGLNPPKYNVKYSPKLSRPGLDHVNQLIKDWGEISNNEIPNRDMEGYLQSLIDDRFLSKDSKWEISIDGNSLHIKEDKEIPETLYIKNTEDGKTNIKMTRGDLNVLEVNVDGGKIEPIYYIDNLGDATALYFTDMVYAINYLYKGGDMRDILPFLIGDRR